jgi:flagellin
MKELAVQSASGTYSDTDRAALDLEFQQLMQEIDRIATKTEWNEKTLLNGGNDNYSAASVTSTTVDLQIGAGSNQTMRVTLKSWVPEVAFYDTAASANPTSTINANNPVANAIANSAYGEAVLTVNNPTTDNAGGQEAGVNTSGVNIANPTDQYIDIKKADAAVDVIAQLDVAITAAAAERATYGAYINRLEYASNNLLNVAQNTDASRSQIEDADYAAETSELARTQIIAQASTAMLAQANQSKQSVLALLQ